MSDSPFQNPSSDSTSNSASPIVLLDSGDGATLLASEVSALTAHRPVVAIKDEASGGWGAMAPLALARRIGKLSDAARQAFPDAQLFVASYSGASALRTAGCAAPLLDWTAEFVAESLTGPSLRVLCTSTTERMGVLRARLEAACPQLQVEVQACPGLARAIELTDRDGLRHIARDFSHFDETAVLFACTHYAALGPFIAGSLNPLPFIARRLVGAPHALVEAVKPSWDSEEEAPRTLRSPSREDDVRSRRFAVLSTSNHCQPGVGYIDLAGGDSSRLRGSPLPALVPLGKSTMGVRQELPTARAASPRTKPSSAALRCARTREGASWA